MGFQSDSWQQMSYYYKLKLNGRGLNLWSGGHTGHRALPGLCADWRNRGAGGRLIQCTRATNMDTQRLPSQSHKLNAIPLIKSIIIFFGCRLAACRHADFTPKWQIKRMPCAWASDWPYLDQNRLIKLPCIRSGRFIAMKY